MKYVFNSKIESRMKEFNLFLLLSGLSFVLTIVGMWVSVNLFDVSPNIANLLVAFLVLLTSFVLRKLVFEGEKFKD